jgi:pimeloyl-ACP methyl ester carboxylesterase
VQELTQELGIYLLSFDRPGYGESDPHPGRTEDSIVFDIQELLDGLDLGSKFYLTGFSMGGEIMWSCLKHIPHR